MTAPERLLLAQQLVDSVLAEAMPLTPSQAPEVRNRAAAIDQGVLACEPWSAVRARLTRPE
jgi:putative addiction module component (TIGR02574 family)